MLKACSVCGKIHSDGRVCNGRRYAGGKERELRNTYAWHTKAEAVKASSNWLCAVCKAEGRYTYQQLETHHISKLAKDESGWLDDDNLICLCVTHHKEADAGQIDADYLRELVRKQREGNG